MAELKCPHCGLMYWYSRDQEPPKVLGNTYQECEKCHKKFLSPMFYEWENLTKEEKRYVLFSQNFWDFGIVEGLSSIVDGISGTVEGIITIVDGIYSIVEGIIEIVEGILGIVVGIYTSKSVHSLLVSLK